MDTAKETITNQNGGRKRKLMQNRQIFRNRNTKNFLRQLLKEERYGNKKSI